MRRAKRVGSKEWPKTEARALEEGQMRQGRKSRRVRAEGYKRHVLHDLDSALLPAVGLT
jgi:hypothetical protein